MPKNDAFKTRTGTLQATQTALWWEEEQQQAAAAAAR
jgi:hypothetical protein